MVLHSSLHTELKVINRKSYYMLKNGHFDMLFGGHYHFEESVAQESLHKDRFYLHRKRLVEEDSLVILKQKVPEDSL